MEVKSKECSSNFDNHNLHNLHKIGSLEGIPNGRPIDKPLWSDPLVDLRSGRVVIQIDTKQFKDWDEFHDAISKNEYEFKPTVCECGTIIIGPFKCTSCQNRYEQ